VHRFSGALIEQLKTCECPKYAYQVSKVLIELTKGRIIPSVLTYCSSYADEVQTILKTCGIPSYCIGQIKNRRLKSGTLTKAVSGMQGVWQEAKLSFYRHLLLINFNL
jgi:hypothetical protein